MDSKTMQHFYQNIDQYELYNTEQGSANSLTIEQ